jgi:hypothetical protein
VSVPDWPAAGCCVRHLDVFGARQKRAVPEAYALRGLSRRGLAGLGFLIARDLGDVCGSRRLHGLCFRRPSSFVSRDSSGGGRVVCLILAELSAMIVHWAEIAAFAVLGLQMAIVRPEEKCFALEEIGTLHTAVLRVAAGICVADRILAAERPW